MSARAHCNFMSSQLQFLKAALKNIFFTDDTKRNGKIYLHVTQSTNKCVKRCNLPKNIFRHRAHGEQSR